MGISIKSILFRIESAAARTLRIRRAACRDPSRAEKRREILGLAALFCILSNEME